MPVPQPTHTATARREPSDALTMSVQDVTKLIPLSRGAAYRAVRNGDIPSVKIGGKYFVVRARFNEMFGIVEDEQNGSA